MTERSIAGAVGVATYATASTVWYGAFGGDGASTVPNTTEANAQVKFRGTGTLVKLRVNINANTRATATVVTVRKNGADTGLTISIGAGVTGTLVDSVNTASFAAGDTWDYSISTGTGAGSIRICSVAAELQTSTQTFTQQCSFGALTSSVQRAMGFWGSLVNTGADSGISGVALESATISNLQVIVSANASAGFTVKSRKNGADGNQVVTVGSTLTGIFEDITNTDTLVAGDTYNAMTSNPAASITITACAVKYLGATANRAPLSAGSNTTALASGATRYSGMFGRSLDASTEGNVQTAAPLAGILSKLSCNVRTNASTAGATLVSRINGVSGTQAVSITASTTGLFQDLTHTDAFSEGDLLSTMASGSNGNIDFSWVGMLNTSNADPVIGGDDGSSMLLMGVAF